jgi:hypothetical protein
VAARVEEPAPVVVPVPAPVVVPEPPEKTLYTDRSDHAEPQLAPVTVPAAGDPFASLVSDPDDVPPHQSLPHESENDDQFEEPENFDELINQIEPPIGTIDKEGELDFDRAIPDPGDPEVLVVPHKVSGERLRLRKGFSGARIVDLENKVVDHLPPIDENNYDIPKTVIDEEDVGIATLTSFRGDKIKVRR